MTNVLTMSPGGEPGGIARFGADERIGQNRRSEPGGRGGEPPAPAQATLLAALDTFSEISLEATNKSASMLKRIDNKYVVDQEQLLSALEVLRNDFRILTIDGRHIFSYESCYFDDDRQCFNEHRQGRRQRFKVRTRRYVESDKAFFEVKMKGRRGQTDKSRKACDHYHSFVMNDGERRMVSDLYETSYGKAFRYNMAPALHVGYRRFTLVSVSGSERVTVDLNIRFETPCGKQASIGDDFIIIETKTADGRGKSDRALKQQHIRRAAGCSKYCVGMALTGAVKTFNTFRPIVKRARSRMLAPGDQCLLQDALDEPGIMTGGTVRCSK